jgi:hypothetical protein
MGVTVGVAKRDRITAHYAKNDARKGYLTINLGTTVVWMHPESARTLAEAILAVLNAPPPAREQDATDAPPAE